MQKHYGCTFDDVIGEDVSTTNLATFLEVSAYRSTLPDSQRSRSMLMILRSHNRDSRSC